VVATVGTMMVATAEAMVVAIMRGEDEAVIIKS